MSVGKEAGMHYLDICWNLKEDTHNFQKSLNVLLLSSSESTTNLQKNNGRSMHKGMYRDGLQEQWISK